MDNGTVMVPVEFAAEQVIAGPQFPFRQPVEHGVRWVVWFSRRLPILELRHELVRIPVEPVRRHPVLQNLERLHAIR